MNVVVDLPNEKLAKQFLAAKPKDLGVKTTVKKKKIGVVGISKEENVQLGLILRWVALELDWDTIPNEVLVNPEALTKLIWRYKAQ